MFFLRSFLLFLGLTPSRLSVRLFLYLRALPFFASTASLNVDPNTFDNQAILLGSGSSINSKYCQDILVFEPRPYVVTLNTTLFSGIPYNLGLFEMTRLRKLRTLILQAFKYELHLCGALPDSHRICVNISSDSIDDHLFLSNGFFDCFSVGSALKLPLRKSKLNDLYVLFMMRLYLFTANIPFLPSLILVRCSAIRAILLLIKLGFHSITLVGFDGDSSYYFTDSRRYPELDLMRQLDVELQSDHILPINSKLHILHGRSNSSAFIHRTFDESLGYYNFPHLLELIAKNFDVSFTNLSKQ